MPSSHKTSKFRLKKKISQAIKEKKDIQLLKVEMECENLYHVERRSRQSIMDKLMKRNKEKPITHYLQLTTKEFDKLHVEVEKESHITGLVERHERDIESGQSKHPRSVWVWT